MRLSDDANQPNNTQILFKHWFLKHAANGPSDMVSTSRQESNSNEGKNITVVKKLTSATSPQATTNHMYVGENTINKWLKKYKFLDYKQVDDHDVFCKLCLKCKKKNQIN